MSLFMDDRHDLARRARAATGLNQRAFARLLGVNAATVCAWERGGRNPARRMRMMLRLVCALPEQCMEVLLVDDDAQGDDAQIARHERDDEGTRDDEEGGEPGDAEGAIDVREGIRTAALRLRRGPRGVVALDQLRAAPEVSGVSPVELDRHLLALEVDGALALRPPLFPGQLSEAERNAALHDPLRGDLLFLESLPEEPLDS